MSRVSGSERETESRAPRFVDLRYASDPARSRRADPMAAVRSGRDSRRMATTSRADHLPPAPNRPASHPAKRRPPRDSPLPDRDRADRDPRAGRQLPPAAAGHVARRSSRQRPHPAAVARPGRVGVPAGARREPQRARARVRHLRHRGREARASTTHGRSARRVTISPGLLCLPAGVLLLGLGDVDALADAPAPTAATGGAIRAAP